MGMNRVPIDKSMTKERAISQGGYYNTDGDWNCIVTLDKYPGKILRGRVEVLILKDGKLFMVQKDNGNYRVPGGGFDKGVLNIDQAFIETKEEAKMIIEDIKYAGVTYIKMYDEIWKYSENEISYDGTYNEVYIAKYKDDYTGYIRRGLNDKDLTNNGKFYDLEDVKDTLKEPHKRALENMLNNVVRESVDEELIMKAQDIQNTIKGFHKLFNVYNCIHNIDIESDDDGLVFAEYNASNTREFSDVSSFIKYCNNSLKGIGYVEEPQSYKGHGFLYIKYNN